MIDTRQEMLIALAEACELEHNLACLYLFAAFTIKTDPVLDQVTPEQAAVLKRWKSSVLLIAKQEMGHLGIVCNLLTAIGGSSHFRRPNFPQPPKYYPPEIDFSLERFGWSALRRFIEFERPEDAEPLDLLAAAPDPLPFTRVGDLYRKIRAGFEAIAEDQLFINRDAPQDEDPWSPAVDVRRVQNRAEALAALDAIIEEGEGTPAASGNSHYELFKKIADELRAILQQDPSFAPARLVADNPQTRKPRDAQAGSLISDPLTREVAELFNVLYGLMLRVLTQYYAFSSETEPQRGAMRGALIQIMRQVIRPLGEQLTRLPMGPDHPELNAGPGFEIYGEEPLSTRPRVAWDVFLERLDLHGKQAQNLAAQLPSPNALGAIAQRLGSLHTQLTAIKPT